MHERTDNRPHIEDTMTKLPLATLALAIAFIATAPAFANPTDARYPAGYQDMAYSKNGW